MSHPRRVWRTPTGRRLTRLTELGGVLYPKASNPQNREYLTTQLLRKHGVIPKLLWLRLRPESEPSLEQVVNADSLLSALQLAWCPRKERRRVTRAHAEALRKFLDQHDLPRYNRSDAGKERGLDGSRE